MSTEKVVAGVVCNSGVVDFGLSGEPSDDGLALFSSRLFEVLA